ncbi:response regulator [Mesohalobacter halotolerans]|uniref:Response regulator n=1 Tax=Mesohalobacter halotolerans TaxID=1883405 RepID=A0A4U5TPK5_9FLAO|nr:response regulator [Mesohalobacter halotolerans]TKS55916.1 response regulator [Mesohalobacter halotolerans]
MAKKILLIEDDITVRENTAEILELSEYEVQTANDGLKGVEEAKSFKPDIIVCDIMMPELDGYGVLETLSKDANTKFIPFIFLSAKTDHKDIRKGMDLGADDYLTKPFEEEELISAIESRLAKTAILQQRDNVQKNNYKLSNFDELKNHLKSYELKSFETSEVVYDSHKGSNYFYMVEKGVVKTYMIDENGKELITALYKTEDVFGDFTFKQNTSKEIAECLEPTRLYCIPKTDFKRFLDANTNMLYDIIDVLDHNLKDTKNQLLDMAYSSVKRKTAQTIILFTERLKRNKLRQIRISRADLAAVAGIAQESLIRTLSKLKKEGLIEIEGRNIKVLDFERLEQIS